MLCSTYNTRQDSSLEDEAHELLVMRTMWHGSQASTRDGGKGQEDLRADLSQTPSEYEVDKLPNPTGDISWEVTFEDPPWVQCLQRRFMYAVAATTLGVPSWRQDELS